MLDSVVDFRVCLRGRASTEAQRSESTTGIEGVLAVQGVFAAGTETEFRNSLATVRESPDTSAETRRIIEVCANGMDRVAQGRGRPTQMPPGVSNPWSGSGPPAPPGPTAVPAGNPAQATPNAAATQTPGVFELDGMTFTLQHCERGPSATVQCSVELFAPDADRTIMLGPHQTSPLQGYGCLPAKLYDDANREYSARSIGFGGRTSRNCHRGTLVAGTRAVASWTFGGVPPTVERIAMVRMAVLAGYAGAALQAQVLEFRNLNL